MSTTGGTVLSETDLVQTAVNIKCTAKDATLYPYHGSAKGGLGTLVASGLQRGGLNRLPIPRKIASASPRLQSGRVSPNRTLSSIANSPTPEHAHEVANREWERSIPHPTNFTSTTRSSRPGDVPPASKWSGISFYENDPKEIKRYMEHKQRNEELHLEQVYTERQNERLRHSTWAAQQREIFNRQRIETAQKYTKSGVPVRPAYVAPSAMETTTSENMRGESFRSGNGQFTQDMLNSQVSSRSLPLPKPTYIKAYERLASERAQSASQNGRRVREVMSVQSARVARKDVEAQLKELEDFESKIELMERQKARPTRRASRANMSDASTIDR